MPWIRPAERVEAAAHLRQELALKVTGTERGCDVHHTAVGPSLLLERSHRSERGRYEKHCGNARRQRALPALASACPEPDRGRTAHRGDPDAYRSSCSPSTLVRAPGQRVPRPPHTERRIARIAWARFRTEVQTGRSGRDDRLLLVRLGRSVVSGPPVSLAGRPRPLFRCSRSIPAQVQVAVRPQRVA